MAVTLTKTALHLKLLLLVFVPDLMVTIDVDISYCKPIPTEDVPMGDGRPFLFIGDTGAGKSYYITRTNLSADFNTAALSTCAKYDFEIATIKTDCEFGLLFNWFKRSYPTDFAVWIGGHRFGDFMEPRWVLPYSGPINLSQFGANYKFIGGPYPPGGYSPIVHPWVNCLSLSRNCPRFTGAHQNPCSQTPTFPELQFEFDDCRVTRRILCQNKGAG